MARVKSYSTDNVLTDNDRLLGTDAAGGLNSTQNFTLGDLKDFVALGVDVAKGTPKGHIPAINQASNDAEWSSLHKSLSAPLNLNVRFFTMMPETPENEMTDLYQVNKGTFTMYNSGSGWFLDVLNYTGEIDLYSFVGKNFTANIMQTPSVTVTGTIGALQEIDDKYYYLNAEGNPVFRFAVTRTGNIDTTWGVVNTSRGPITELYFLAAANLNNNVRRATVNVSGVFNAISDVTIAGDLKVDGEVDFSQIPFEEHDEGTIWNEMGKTNSVSMLLNTDSARVNPWQTGFTTNGGVMQILPRKTVAADTSATTTYYDNYVDEFNFARKIFTTTQTRAQDEADIATGGERSRTGLIIDHDGITTTYFDGSAAGLIQPVTANDITTYRKPATDTIAQGPQNEGVLTTLQIGDEYYSVPTSVSQVAQTLPGLSEALSPIPSGNIIRLERQNIGTRDNTSIPAAGRALADTIADIGEFAFYESGSATLAITAAGIVTNSGSTELASLTTGATIDNADYFLIESSRISPAVAIGNQFTLYNNTVGSTNFFRFTISGVATHTIGERRWYLFTMGTSAFTGGTFNLGTGVYQGEITQAPPVGSITPAYWFYGIDHGTFVEFRSVITDRADIAAQPAGVPAFARGSTQYIGATGNVFNQNDVINTAYTHIPEGQRLFWTTVNPSVSAGATVPGLVYEVVAYVHNNGNTVSSTAQATLSWSLVGEGTMIISAPSIRLPNLVETTSASPNVLVTHPTTDRIETIDLDPAGFTQAVSYLNTDDTTENGTVTSISFEGGADNDERVATGGGALVVDVSGRIPFDTTLHTAAFNALPWRTYMLGTISTGTTVRLPASTGLVTGTTVRFVNLSEVDTDGTPVGSSDWTISPAMSERTTRIMRDTGSPDTELVLDDGRIAFDLIWSGNTAVGWIVR